MYQTACPACGAEVTFRATTSLTAVCGYCRSTLLREGDSVRNIGKMAELLADYSPLQIVSSGQYQGRHFTVVGRIQLQYEAGIWNEWHVLFDDGASGWLAESVGQYVLTFAQTAEADWPVFGDLVPGYLLKVGGQVFGCSDVREAKIVAAEGELPRQTIISGFKLPLADARSGSRFLTLDYGDDRLRPTLYLGEAVTLKQLGMQRLRAPEQIAKATGKLPGSAVVLDCPSCGGGLDYRAGAAHQLVCPACGSEVEIAAERAELIRSQRVQDHTPPSHTLQLGNHCTIDGKRWELIGVLRWAAVEERSSQWDEYLLYHAGTGFRWLVEAADGWWLGSLMDVWVDGRGDSFVYAGQKYQQREAGYEAEILYAAGAFPWRARRGDRVNVREYLGKDGKTLLACEQNDKELVWSQSRRVSDDDITRWLGGSGAIPSRFYNPVLARKALQPYAWGAIGLLLLINLPLMFSRDDVDAALMITGLAALLLWLPARGEEE